MNITSDWLVRIDSNMSTDISIICFPYAGGDVAIFSRWQSLCPNNIAIYAVQLPGRGRSATRPFIDKIGVLTQAIYQDIKRYLDGDIILYGHSNGALLALDLACHFKSLNDNRLKHVIFSGKNFPDMSVQALKIDKNSSPYEVKALLAEYGATPSELLNSEGFLSYYLPIFKSDIVLVAGYVYPLKKPLPYPCSFIHAKGDRLVHTESLYRWEQVSEHYQQFEISGDHFVIDSNPELITCIINTLVQEYKMIIQLTL
ncbi:thioesterase II family protein [Pseudoalteromonas rhizosphaerae]|uniref:Thioesterase II family protein n=1 Tax=Pseudoalteromonas rhizosphaerae TaxID=2518973 RepID=A0ABW8L1D0_9GAMM